MYGFGWTMGKFWMCVIAGICSAGMAQAEFSLSFEWGDIPLCKTGRPNTVGAPAFVLKDLPVGTARVDFRLKDRNVPSYNHGGGKVKISTGGQLPFGTFKYKSPCPPSGSHTYEWTATARSASGKALGKARARRPYPE